MKKINMKYLVMGIFMTCFFAECVNAIDITTCQNLSVTNGYYNLINDLNVSGGSCFNITAHNVTLNGNGHLIIYAISTGGGFSAAIKDSKYNNFTLKNIFLKKTSGISNADAIQIEFVDGFDIYNVTTNLTTGGCRVGIAASKNGLIHNNSFFGLATGYNLYIVGQYIAYPNQIYNNRIYTKSISGLSVGEGIYCFGSSEQYIYDNDIEVNVNGKDGRGNGIYMFYCLNNRIYRNNILVYNAKNPNNYLSGFGIFLRYTWGNLLINNTVRSLDHYDYSLNTKAHSNIFKHENMSGGRDFWIYDIANNNSFLKMYYNESFDIQLSTEINNARFNRSIQEWTNISMIWNDTNVTGYVNPVYNITGLENNITYEIYKTVLGVRTNIFNYTTTDGKIIFMSPMNGNTQYEIIYPITEENITVEAIVYMTIIDMQSIGVKRIDIYRNGIYVDSPNISEIFFINATGEYNFIVNSVSMVLTQGNNYFLDFIMGLKYYLLITGITLIGGVYILWKK